MATNTDSRASFPATGQGADPSADQGTGTKCEFVLRLYIAGHSPNSERAKSQLNYICTTYLSSAYRIEYVDVWENPEVALADRVFATPALCKLQPGPVTLIFGNLSHTEQVLHALGIEVNATP